MPNFFIAGAPKCGTTALRYYLMSHPRVFMSPVKEPGYWAEDLPGHREVRSRDDYLALFSAATSDQTVVGESTATYLYSDIALEAIRSFNPEVKVVAMFRNPVDQAHSFHAQMYYNGDEDEPDFRRAWELQGARAAGRRIPRRCLDAKLLQYREVAMFGRQCERLFALFPRENVHIILLEDMAADPRGTYLKVLGFLGLEDDGRVDFPRVNESKVHKVQWLGAWMHHPPDWALRLNSMVKRCLGVERTHIKHLFRTRRKRPPLPEDLRRRMERDFAEDVSLLERLLGRKLNWFSPAGRGHEAASERR
ncbi:MAG: sulfotransferase family protein [Phycisphaerae bacterium]